MESIKKSQDQLRERKIIYREFFGIRLLAVLMVVTVHFMSVDRYPGVIWWRGVGVTFFFIVGAFLATASLLRYRDRVDVGGLDASVVWRRFALRRFIRLFPLVGFYLATLVILGATDFRASLLWHAGLLSNLYFAWTGGFTQYLDHLWFLGAQEQYLFLLAGVLLFLPRKTFLVWIVGLILICPIYRLIIHELPHGPGRWDALPLAWTSAMGLGSLLGWMLWKKGGRPADRFERMVYLGGGLVGLCGYLAIRIVETGTRIELPVFVLKSTIDALLCFSILGILMRLEIKPLSMVLGSRFMELLSHLSYGIYVWHLAAIHVVIVVVGKTGYPLSYIVERTAEWVPGLGRILDPLSPPNIVFMVLLSMVLAFVSYRIVEIPAERLGGWFPIVPARPSSVG
ncbi:MAG: acyltransferase [Phycisphaeraceae bacterium]|nr:acyltransferase [Phycisphaeraceae bacterium]